MLEILKQRVCKANRLLKDSGLAELTWGNVSAISPDRNFVVIKPSGLSYESMQPEHMVVVDMLGNIVEGGLLPSSDLATHLELYRSFPTIGGIVHTRSRYATATAQAEIPLQCYGTSHADFFHGDVPCTRPLTAEEIKADYEVNAGKVIVETFHNSGIDPEAVPGVLVAKHGPFVWGPSPEAAVEAARALEKCAHMALLTREMNPNAVPASKELVDKHYARKHNRG